jgi:ABC-type transporter MlaC component
MKSFKIFSTLILFLFIGISSVQSQNNEVMQNLTQEQQQLLKQQRELVVANREAFKATLTAEQLSILDNKELTKQERLKNLVSTFTSAQKELMSKNKANIDALKETFKNSMTTEQRQHMQTQNMNKMREMNNDGGGHRKRN